MECLQQTRSITVILGVALFLAAPSALAQKKGGTTNPCEAADLEFPAFINGITVTRNRVLVTEPRLADRRGACQVALPTPGRLDDLLLIDLGGGAWRTAWSRDNGTAIEVRDYDVGANATVSLRASATLATAEPVLFIEAARGGNLVFTTAPAGDYVTPPKVWRADVTGGPASVAVAATLLGSLGGACNVYDRDLAIGPDGDTLYFLPSSEAGGVRTYTLKRFSLADPELADKLASCTGLDDPGSEFKIQGGNTNQFAVGRCGTFACIAIERINVRGVPCTPDYYRTDVYNLDVPAALPAVLQLAYPAWGARDELIGRQTGSTSKNACTAKIYTQAARHTVSLSGEGNVAASAPALIGSAELLDAPNPID